MIKIKSIFIIMISLIIIFVSFIHPEMVTEQFGVISRERKTIYDYFIFFGMIILLIIIMHHSYLYR
ncbi:hypothetical protein IOLA_195 [uncultured bacterium]|nr:hypothetical protein IOLA_195 [uncultured bacterium]